MAKEDRLQLIREIEEERRSKVLCYLTGDRRGFETRIHPEVNTMLYNHLRKMDRSNKIDLFLYSTGGVTMAALSIVNLIREFCDEFAVIIPFKAFSTATLISLGANEILMSKLGQLGPVDPSVTMPFNPPVPGRPGQVLPISVEEVHSFIDFCKNKKFLGLKSEDALKDVLRQLTEKVHPLALGSVYRAIEQIQMVSRKLLGLHMSLEEDKKEIDQIVEALTRTLYSHDYIINWKEAKENIGLKVKNLKEVNAGFEDIVYRLFKEYEQEMSLTDSFSPEVLLGSDQEAGGTFNRAYVESNEITDVFLTEKTYRRVQQTPPVVPVPTEIIEERIIREGWEQI